MCLLFYECTWALKPSVVQKSHICLCEIEKKKQREGEREKEQGCKTDIALISLECHWCLISLCKNIRGAITGEDESKDWPAEERLSLIYCTVFLNWIALRLGTFDSAFRANQNITMLNILLSALMDRERSLWTFRRTERFASILVRILFVFKCTVFMFVLQANSIL